MKIIVFDDDPTGSQTVYGCPLLLKWDKETLIKGIQNPSPLLFLLTNTRSLSPELAELRIRDICRILKEVIKEIGLSTNEIVFVSRGDSTLRGHGVLEPETINQELGPFDATFHIPAFFEGGRTTINGIHFLNDVPVHQTNFAQDKIFGYSTSNLNEWLEEKSKLNIKAKDVCKISIKQLEDASKDNEKMNKFIGYLYSLSDNKIVTVDASKVIHLQTFTYAINALRNSKRFLFRSAASLINSLANISCGSNPFDDFSSLILKDHSANNKPGIIIIGSHVPLSDIQLKALLCQESCIGIEVNVNESLKFFDNDEMKKSLNKFENNLLKEILYIIDANKTPVLYTSRGEVLFSSNLKRMRFGIFLAELMANLVSRCLDNLGYIISKGGITTNILLSEGLKLSLVNLRGQVLPGLSVVSPEEGNTSLPIVTFPGNLGDENTLLEVWKIMENC